MLVLFETAAGHALFKVQDEAKLASADDVFKHFSTPEKAAKVLKLKGFNAFKDTTEAVAAATDMDKLAVSDKALGSLIKEKLSIACVNDSAVNEVMRGIRANMDTLITGLEDDDLKAMTLGLSHSLSRYKLKFSADKVDTMIVQAIGLLDELDKEINTYSMRVREWFGWHFPEMGKIVTDNLQYAKCVLKMGMRTQVKTLDFSDILSEDVEASMREVCEVSMGTDISEEDVINISALCEQNRMNAIAPNLTVMVGELVGARLIAHAGSLMNLAKHPASTVQILGAEKALFRALKTKHDTPKYDCPKHKGKISRVLAAKTALAVRVDALGDSTRPRSASTTAPRWRPACAAGERLLGRAQQQRQDQEESKKYVKTETSKSYNADADMTVSSKKRRGPKVKKDKKHKKKKSAEENSDDKKDKKKKHKKKKSAEE
ncbi:NOSIC protein [Phytophthora cactorum]|nr:NOSIC protein [Phytophthora cactorum]